MPNNITPPDFDDMMKIAESISSLTRSCELLDIDIKLEEANVVRTATVDPQYFQGGKTPSMEYIKSTWKFTGFDGSLVDKRRRLAELESDLEKAKLTFSVMKDMISLYQTESANNRKSLL